MRRSTTSRRGSAASRLAAFEQRLVLQRWLMSLFGATDLDQLLARLRDPERAGFDEHGFTKFLEVLTSFVKEHKGSISDDDLVRYDQAIVRAWRHITERRVRHGPPIYPTYFQYLALLFTEIYLDWYIEAPHLLAQVLNEFLARESIRGIEPYGPSDLNKLAFWMATGSGKTLIAHANILQYQAHVANDPRRAIDRIILLTPNEGLSRQHVNELVASGIEAELFSPDVTISSLRNPVLVIDIHKLREEAGEKTIAIEALEGRNLVLIDEGHRGASASEIGSWMAKRNQLCENGFAFEYSATFGQAIRAASDPRLEQTYAKAILFEYSYRRFYNDGYGKDYRILNLSGDRSEDVQRRYLTACLLSFYQQLRLYEATNVQAFLIERPLWIFVGGSVNAVRHPSSGVPVSDVIEILTFIETFVRDRKTSVAIIGDLLAGRSRLLGEDGRDLFVDAFRYIQRSGESADTIFDDILVRCFNTPSPATLHLERLSGPDGEIALRLGDNPIFGLITVGDPGTLAGLCRTLGFSVREAPLTSSLFGTIASPTSRIHLLIGAKKFIEGWSSWRVSTMGLLNVGRNEGPQIIQLFGRGVRLKGFGFSLKRTAYLKERRLLTIDVPVGIEALETLNIFGVRADYMRQFKDYLAAEGIPTERDRETLTIPVRHRVPDGRLKTLRRPSDDDAWWQETVVLAADPPEAIRRHRIVVDWYPRLETLASKADNNTNRVARDVGVLEAAHIDFLDLDRLWFDLVRYKRERGWSNLIIPRSVLRAILDRSDWYVLYAPNDVLAVRSGHQISTWQRIAAALLTGYLDRFYRTKKAAFDAERLSYATLTESDQNLITEYQISIARSEHDLITTLRSIKEAIEQQRSIGDRVHGSLRVLDFDRHLYTPLIYNSSPHVEIIPTVLANDGELAFVEDLKAYCDARPARLSGYDLYLLRNQSRGKGIGFFEADNFYPDFILWAVTDDRQYVTFIDPKGLRNLDGPADPKVALATTIKEIADRLNDSTVVLNAIILSQTESAEICRRWGCTKDDLIIRHVLFPREDQNYLDTLFDRLTT
jgi:hypothetical protein